MLRKLLAAIGNWLFLPLLLLAVFLAACSGQKQKIAKAQMGIRGIRMALIRYAMHDGVYPTTEQGLQALIEKPTLPPEPKRWDGPYLNPENLIDPWDSKYVYRSPSTEDPKQYKYDLYSYGPNRRDGGDDDISIRSVEEMIEQHGK